MSADPLEDMATIAVRRDVAAAVNAQVESGAYRDQDAVVREGLRLIGAGDRLAESEEVERWLREVAVPTARQILADPSSTLTVEEVESHLAEQRSMRDDSTPIL